MVHDVTPRTITPAAGLPIRPPGAIPRPADARNAHRRPPEITQTLHPNNAIAHETVKFDAACPACGADAKWTQNRDTQVAPILLTIACGPCARRDVKPPWWPA